MISYFLVQLVGVILEGSNYSYDLRYIA